MQTETTSPSAYASQVLSKKMRLPTHLQSEASIPLHLPSSGEPRADTKVETKAPPDPALNPVTPSQEQNRAPYVFDCLLGCCQNWMNPWGAKSK